MPFSSFRLGPPDPAGGAAGGGPKQRRGRRSRPDAGLPPMCARRSWLARGDRGGAKIEVSLAASMALSSAVGTTATLPSWRRQQPSKWRAQGLWPARGDREVATIAANVLGGFLYFSSAIWTGALKPP